MTRDTRAAYLAELERLTPATRKAFEEAIADVRGARLMALEEAVSAGDWRGVLDILRMDERVFDRLDRAIDNAFYQGGVYQLSHLGKKTSPSGRGASLTIRFQGRHPRAEATLRTQSGTLIREIIDDQRELIREVVTRGLTEGRNPRSTALDLIGRRPKGGLRRRGGIVGLHSQQVGWVESMRAELSHPETLSGYFDRRARDRRFDRTVAKAIREGRGLSRSEVNKISGRYADILLRKRGETIARTETIRALNSGRDEAIQQLIESGEVPAEAVKVVWSATMDARTRDAHRSLDGQEIQHGDSFQSPTGARLRFPGDTSLGAGGADTIGCRCSHHVRVDWLSLAV